MSLSVQIIAISMSIVFNFYIFRMLRKGFLDFKYTLLWILSGIFMLFASIYPKSVAFISDILGISQPINFLFFFSIIFLLIMLLQMTIILSKYKNNIYEIAQKLALLQKKIDDMIVDDSAFEDTQDS